jgi:tRNA A37 methylthiotransferase MiaB
MTTQTLERIETAIAQLSLAEQLLLMQRLAYRIRQSSLHPLQVRDDDLAAMAADPAIQHELHHIASEFAVTEGDGLDRV